MKNPLFSIITCLAYGLNLSAQDVSGVEILSHMTKEQVILHFGKPDRYSREDYSDIDGIYEWYHYGTDYLLFINQELHVFQVSSSRWPVLLNLIEGGVRIGDSFSKMEKLNPQIVDWVKGSDKYYVPFEDFPLLITVHDGKITGISYEVRSV